MKKGWEVKKLGEVCDLINRGISPRYSKEKGLCVLNQRCIRDHKVNFEFSQLHDDVLKPVNEERIIKIGDVLVNSTGTGTLGRVAQIRETPIRSTVDSHVTIVRPIRNLFINDFFGYALIAIEEQIALKGEGCGGQTELARDILRNEFRIIYPKSLPEQQRIVAILDKSFEAIATAKANAAKNLQNARDLFESYLESAFANPGEGWEEKKLGEICKLITDGKHGDCQNEENSGYYFLSAKDVNNGTLNFENARQITKSDFLETHRRTDLKPGDVLVTNSGTIGRMAIAPYEDKTFKTTFQKSVAIIKPISSIMDNIFCCYQLRADLAKLVNISAGTAQKNLLIGDLKNHLVSFPTLSEQKRIVVKLDTLSAETQKLEAIYQKKLADLEELKKSILQKAFEGELTA